MFSIERLGKRRKQWIAIAAIALGSVVTTLLLSKVPFFQLVHLKARDLHFMLRGKLPTPDIVLVVIDQKTLDHFPELMLFWHPYYATAIEAAAEGGAKVMALDVTFAVPVKEWAPDHDRLLSEAVLKTADRMPVVCSFIPGTLARQHDWVIPVNMTAEMLGVAALANLTADPDDFVRNQELLESEKAGEPSRRSLALRVAEKFRGADAEFRDGRLTWQSRPIPIAPARTILINYAGPAGTFPRISLSDFVEAARSGNKKQIREWVNGKAVLLGEDGVNDRHATPFYTTFSGSKWNTAGIEIHANTLRTLLQGDYLAPVSNTVRTLFLAAVATTTAVVSVSLVPTQTAFWLNWAVLGTAMATHLMFRAGLIISTSELLLGGLVSVLGSMAYRFLTAEKRGALFQSAVSVFVGKRLAASLSETGKISLSGTRQLVTILFSDIRGFTAFCEEKDPGLVVDLLNAYMGQMVKIIVNHKGSVNKFIGDGILAIFSDDDEGATPGDHAYRAVQCGLEMARVQGQFKTGVGIHSGQAVVGNVGSQDKMEYTVLGDTVNLASRLESLNKEMKTQLLFSGATDALLDGRFDAVSLGDVPVRGIAVPIKLYTAAALRAAVAESKAVVEKS